MFQLIMANDGYFIRGAISLAPAYIDDIAVFGEALNEAYIGESNQARDPRIILMPTATNAVQHHLTYYGKPEGSPHARAILKDADGQLFVNYLDCILIAEDEQGPFFEELEKHKAQVERRLEQYRAQPVIWSKYAWVAAYHNYFCSMYPEYFTDEYRVDIELFRSSPSLIV